MPRTPPKTRRVVLLMEPERHDEIARTADQHGISVAEYIRLAIEAFDIRGRL